MLSIKTALEEAGYNVDVLDTAVVEVFRRAIAGVAVGAKNEWIRLAQSRLRTSRADYINGLQQQDSFIVTMVDGEPVYTISLVGEMPNNFEFGMPSFDMKTVRPGWLGGAKAKVAEDGHRYVVVPFRHSTSSNSNLGYSGKALMAGGSTNALQGLLKTAIKDYGLDRMVKAGGQVVPGPTSRVPAGAPVHPYLQGLTRVQSPPASPKGRGSAQMVTWRIMSENGDPSSWIHPGLSAQNLLAEVERWVDAQMKVLIETTMKAAS